MESGIVETVVSSPMQAPRHMSNGTAIAVSFYPPKMYDTCACLPTLPAALLSLFHSIHGVVRSSPLRIPLHDELQLHHPSIHPMMHEMHLMTDSHATRPGTQTQARGSVGNLASFWSSLTRLYFLKEFLVCHSWSSLSK